jgi:hypothetical protein
MGGIWNISVTKKYLGCGAGNLFSAELVDFLP